MKKCRCCRQLWPLECYEVCRPDGLLRGKCKACQRNCGPARKRRAVARTRAWKAALRADVLALRTAS
jgi:hypothetical protein